MDIFMKLVETITVLNGHEDDKTKAKLFDDIYRISHIANNRCKNKHEDWKKEVDKMIESYNNI